jgi:hypothetical protein
LFLRYFADRPDAEAAAIAVPGRNRQKGSLCVLSQFLPVLDRRPQFDW